MFYEKIVNEMKKLISVHREKEAKEILEKHRLELGEAYTRIDKMIDSEVRNRDSA